MGKEAAELLGGFHGARVLCAGDAMLDRYIYGNATRISPEAPVPVVHVKKQTVMPGGVGNVVVNLADLGATPMMVTVVGDDDAAGQLEAYLTNWNSNDRLETRLIRDAARPTIVKTRIIAGIQQVVRFDEEAVKPLSSEMCGKFLSELDLRLASVKAVAVSDYGKGVVAGDTIGRVIALAHARGVPVVIDPKGNDYGRYRNADLVKPNRKEIAEAVNRQLTDRQEVVEAGREIMAVHGIKNILVTLSDEGMLLLRDEDKGRVPVLLPSKAREVFDVTGAGDTVLSVMAATLAVGAPLALGARLATLAAGVVVGKVGTATAKPEEIARMAEESE
jgi:ADP-heptose synthase, bifunctional sugar kinase/adenylyltransferase